MLLKDYYYKTGEEAKRYIINFPLHTKPLVFHRLTHDLFTNFEAQFPIPPILEWDRIQHTNQEEAG